MENYKTEIFTGMRATSGLTIANLMGALQPILNILEDPTLGRPMVFVADLHSLTTNEPKDTQRNVLEVIKDYIAAGLDPDRVDIFVQSQISPEISKMTIYLSRLITVAELLRVPTLKEKIKKGNGEATANGLLALYPVMMAADILLQDSQYVPTGKDQYAHLEVTCDLANRFNKKYGDTLLLPKPLEMNDEPINILSLSGNGKKMSKSEPNGAILLDDDIKATLKKIKRAKTAFAGEMNDDLESLVLIANFVSNDTQREQIKTIIDRHMNGEQVMGEFKDILSSNLEEFLNDFQSKKSKIKDEYIEEIIESGAKKAKSNAKDVLDRVESAMSMKFVS